MLHIFVVSDGRTGHEKQSLGVVAALRRRTSVTVTTVMVQTNPFHQFISVLCWLFPFFVPRSQTGRIDLILCCGGKTHFAALARKRAYKTRCCCIMAPGFGFRRFFDLCLIPSHDGLAPDENILITQGSPNLNVDKGEHQKGNGIIVIGGIDETSHYWCEDALLEQVEQVVRYQGWEWILSSSPRTPETTIEGLRKIAGDYPNVGFFYHKDTPRGWLEQQYDKAAAAWITSDSFSMLYEALTAGCRLYIFPMMWKDDNSKYAKNERMFLRDGWAVDFAGWQEGRRSEGKAFNEAQRCANIMLERWWQSELQ